MTTHDDKTLLELAAKAAGYEFWDYNGSYRVRTRPNREEYPEWEPWNPLTDDGDALRLAVKLRMEVNIEMFSTNATVHEPYSEEHEQHGDDPYAATRRAIVRAAAQLALTSVEIGKTL